MSYASMSQSTFDQALELRYVAAVQDEARSNATSGDTAFGRAIVDGSIGTAEIVAKFQWPIAIGTEAEYESAIAGDNPAPGSDPAVIPDQEILSIVQANWPDES